MRKSSASSFHRFQHSNSATILVIFALFFFSSISFSCDGANVVEVLQAEQYSVLYDFINRFPSLLALLTNQTLNNTVFAPTNAAFNEITPPTGNALLQALNYHLTSGAVLSGALTNQELLPSLLIPSGLNAPQVTKITVNGSVISINSGAVVQPNLVATNGIVHGINAFLFPPDTIPNIVAATSTLSTFNSAIQAAQLDGTFSSPRLTAFIPTNAAFAALAQQNPGLMGYLLANNSQSRADLQSVLMYHFTSQNVFYASSIPQGSTVITSLDSSANLTVTNNNGAVTVNSANVIATNVLASNGVIHVIDRVLLPKAFNLNLRQVLLGLNLTTFVSLIDRANLSSLLTQPANSTVFAPTNAALSQIPNFPSDQALIDTLLYHFTPGQILSTLLSNGILLPSRLAPTTLQQPQPLKVFRIQDTVGVNDANITDADNLASNGIVHVIDRVVLPPGNLVTVANSTASLSTLVTALNAAGLVDTVASLANITIFAPVNTGFNALPSYVLNYLLQPGGVNDLRSVLFFHVVPSTVVYSTGVTTTPTTLPTVNGQTVTVVLNGTTIQVNQADVVVKDVLGSNGVAHAINQVLIPNSFFFNLQKALIGVGTTDLLNAIVQAGLANLLNGSAPYTIFAPTNEAFNRHPPPVGQALVNLLQYHIVAGSITSGGLTDGQLLDSQLSLPSLAGKSQKLKVSVAGSTVFINGVNITQSNIMADNGVVHVISDVLTLPPLLPEVVSSTFSTLNRLVNSVDLTNTLNTTTNMTLFAPIDSAFSQLSPALFQYLLLPQAFTDLYSLLLYHILPFDALYAPNIPTGTTNYRTYLGPNVTLSIANNGGLITINSVATVTQPDVLAENGVAHGISSVLLPPGFSFNLEKALLGLNETILLKAFNAAHLSNLLNGTANFTIFAPTNAALVGLNLTNPQLAKILSYHVVAGYLPSTSLGSGELLNSLLFEPTLQGQAQKLKVEILNGSISINGAKVVRANTFASNGVIHVIDTLLMPPGDILSVVASEPTLSILNGLANVIAPTLSLGNLTVFAPSNTAFTSLGQALLSYLQLNSSRATLASVLDYHVLPNAVVYSPNFPTTPTQVPTVNGASVTLLRNNNVVTVNSATVITPDELASNGVVHVIDEVLLPPGFRFTLREALTALDATVLIDLIDKVGLSALLNGTGNYTIFAPTNAALTPLPNITDAQLKQILEYHVVSGIFPTSSLSDGELLPSQSNLATLGGQPQQLKISFIPTFSVNGVNITAANNRATNGVVHVVNQVLLLPEAVPSVIRSTSFLSQLNQLVVAADYSSVLSLSNLTLFAPTNEAFAALGPAIFNYLLQPDAKAELTGVLGYHGVVAAAIYYTPNIPEGSTVLTALNGNTLEVNKSASGLVTINNVASVDTPNILAANGVIQAIDGVLLPPGFVFNLRRALVGINATLFLEAVDRAGLSNLLNGTTQYTIFAPTNQAMASLPTNVSIQDLTEILQYHIVAGSVPSSGLTNGQLLTSLLVLPTLEFQGQKLKVSVSGNQLKINQASVIIRDNVAVNGYVQVIDQVLVAPPDIGTVARNISILSTLTRLVQIVEHQSNFTNPNITALAPSNAAFNALGPAVLGYLLLAEAEEALENVLAYHILSKDIVYTTTLPAGTTTVRTANGLNVTFVKTGNTVTVNNATLLASNVLASNGVLHILNSVLLPSNFKYTLYNALQGLGDTELLAGMNMTALTDGILTGTAKFTVFAPTNDAFKAYLPNGLASISLADLTSLLKNHIIMGDVPLEGGMRPPNLNNQTLVVGPNVSTIALAGSNVVANILGFANAANNGVVYSIDRLILPSQGGDGGSDDGLSTTWIVVIVVVSVVALLAVLGVAGYFGYQYWLKRQNTYVAIGGDDLEG